MDYTSWVNRLSAWGIPNLNAASKKTLFFFIAWTFIKWILIAVAIVYGFVFVVLIAVLISVLTSK
jgi:hypothetical protein